jgi:hypothetical protein
MSSSARLAAVRARLRFLFLASAYDSDQHLGLLHRVAERICDRYRELIVPCTGQCCGGGLEVTRAAEAVRASLAEKLAATRLRHGPITVMSSPRRIAVVVTDVQPREDDEEQVVRGPRMSAAYDADGNPTKAAVGFARGQGISVADLRPLELNGAQYAGLVRHVPGRPAAQVLADVLPAAVAGLRAERNMRWSAPGLSYSRPIRWVVALIGPHVVPFTVAGITSGRVTRVHRTAPEPAVAITAATGYLRVLRDHGIEPDAGARRGRILAGAAELAASVGGQVDLDGEQGVIDEVTNLVEDPAAILGSFDASYLDLPGDILTTVMKKHQRYLPVRAAGGGLLPHFIAIANGDCDHGLVRAGNEAVLRARYEDAAFFWRADLAKPLTDMQGRLAQLTFETQLGSVADRAARIAAIAAAIADRLDLPADERAVLQRAAGLAKFDLGSAMVTELSSLAGGSWPASTPATRALRPRPLVHLQHRADEHVPRAGQHHDERPGDTELPGHRVQPPAELPVVDLRLLARLGRVRAPDRHLRPAGLLRDVRRHVTAEARHAGPQALLVAQPLVDRRHPHPGLQLGGDVLVVHGDRRPRHLPQPRVGQLREPLPDQYLPLALAPGRAAARHDAGLDRRGDVLADRLAVHPQRIRHLAQRPARVPAHQYLGHVDHVERSPCHRPPVLDGRKAAPSRWPGPPRHARRSHGELRDRGGELRDRYTLRTGELQGRRH